MRDLPDFDIEYGGVRDRSPDDPGPIRTALSGGVGRWVTWVVYAGGALLIAACAWVGWLVVTA